MARSFITKEATKYIVETYDSETKSYTFSDISALVSEKYGITVTAQAIHRCYHKYKQKQSTGTTTKTVIPENKIVTKQVETSLQKRPIYSAEKADKPKTFVEKRLTKEEIDALMSPVEND